MLREHSKKNIKIKIKKVGSNAGGGGSQTQKRKQNAWKFPCIESKLVKLDKLLTETGHRPFMARHSKLVGRKTRKKAKATQMSSVDAIVK